MNSVCVAHHLRLEIPSRLMYTHLKGKQSATFSWLSPPSGQLLQRETPRRTSSRHWLRNQLSFSTCYGREWWEFLALHTFWGALALASGDDDESGLCSTYSVSTSALALGVDDGSVMGSTSCSEMTEAFSSNVLSSSLERSSSNDNVLP